MAAGNCRDALFTPRQRMMPGPAERAENTACARVVRTTEEGAGLCFPALGRRSQHRFRRFLMEAKLAARH